MGSFCQRYLFVHSWESTNSGRSRSHLQNLPIFNWSPQLWIAWHGTTFLREKKWRGKKTKNCAEWWKRKDGVEEVEEAGLVNKHIFCRSAGGNALEGQGYEFMTAYDTIVSMGAESMHVPRMSSAWSSRWWWKGMGTPMISQYGNVKLEPG